MIKCVFQSTSMVTLMGMVFCASTAGSDLPDAKSLGKAAKFGVYEIALTGNGSVTNPFDTVATVVFTPPSGQANAKTVYAFYDGDNTWRARVYLSETGEWRWTSASSMDKQLDGKTGTFQVVNSELRGRLLPHPENPRYWITEDGRWFLNINDTAYFLLSPCNEKNTPIPFEDFAAYVRDAVDQGITSLRTLSTVGSKGCLLGIESWSDSIFEDEDYVRMRLDRFRCSDQRLQWLLDHYPDVYIQFIIFPRGSDWGKDELFWKNLTAVQKERVLRYMVARYAAYPQIFWLVVNDAHYGPKYPNNNAFAREAGKYFRQHDPWQHPISTGPARFVDFPFTDEEWATYIHLENAYELGAVEYAKYHSCAKPVFLGEDRYEQDRPNLDPTDMRYFQRRLYWAWLLSGGSANYGGRWWELQPYSKTGERSTMSGWPGATREFTNRLTGLDSVRHIRDYFTTRGIELPDFEPDHGLSADLDGQTGTQAPKVMRRGTDEYLVYHPNAAADGKEARVNDSRNAGLKLDLQDAHGRFSVEWYSAEDGTSQDGGMIEGGRKIEFVSPWTGQDVVLRLVKTPL